MTDNRSSTFCVIPWIQSGLSANGDYLFCCNGMQGPSQGLLHDEKKNVLTIETHDLASQMNAELLKEIRLCALNNIRHPECARCWKEEDEGIYSFRLMKLRQWQHLFSYDYCRSLTGEDGALPPSFRPVYFDLRIGNRCNLKCRMCTPKASTSWYEDYLGLQEWLPVYDSHGRLDFFKKDHRVHMSEEQKYRWADNDRFWDHLKNNLSHVQQMAFSGGEPLLLKKHEEFLQYCVDEKISRRIELEYNTNLTVLPEKIIALWKKFKHVQVGVSLDGAGAINDYIRHPSKWSSVFENIRILDAACDDFLQMWLTPSISLYNIWYLPEFCDWILSSSFRSFGHLDQTRALFSPHLVHFPRFLNIRTLPVSVKRKVAQRLESYRGNINDRYQEKGRHLNSILDGICHYMNSDDYSAELKLFFKYTKHLDQLRGERFEDVMPEFYRELANECQ